MNGLLAKTHEQYQWIKKREQNTIMFVPHATEAQVI